MRETFVVCAAILSIHTYDLRHPISWVDYQHAPKIGAYIRRDQEPQTLFGWPCSLDANTKLITNRYGALHLLTLSPDKYF